MSWLENTHTHLGHTMQYVISQDIKPNINTTTDKIIIILLYGHLWALRKVSEGTQSAPVLVEEGDLSENIIMSHNISCSIVNSYACTGMSLLGCDAVSLGQWFPVFQRNTVPSFPRVKQPTTFQQTWILSSTTVRTSNLPFVCSLCNAYGIFNKNTFNPLKNHAHILASK